MSGSEACGRASEQMFDCRIDHCLCASYAEDFDACINGDAPAGCMTAKQTQIAACGPDLATYEAACKGTFWTFEAPIKAQCIGFDAGADAGADSGL